MATCWCGCGDKTGDRSDFVPGHDRRAESDVIAVEYGSVTAFLTKHGYGPGGKNPKLEREKHDATMGKRHKR